MPLVERYSPQPEATPEELLGIAGIGGDWNAPHPEGVETSPGWWSTAWGSIERNSLIGAGPRRVGYELGSAIQGIDQTPDKGFDPMKLLTDEVLADHPYMLPEIESGRVFEIPNEAAFRYYWSQLQDDYERRAYIGRGPGTARLLGPLAGDLPVFLAGGWALRGLTGAAEAAEAAKALKTLPLAARVARSAAAGFATTTAYEALVKGLDPASTDPEGPALANAAIFGSVIGAAIPLIGPTLRLASSAVPKGVAQQIASPVNRIRGRFFPSSTTESMQRQVERAFVARVPRNITEAVENEAEALRTFLAEDARDIGVLRPIDHPETRPLVEMLRKKYADAGLPLDIGPSPYQADVDWLLGLDELDKSFKNIQTPEGVVGQAAESLTSAPGPFVGVPEPALRKSASDVARTIHPVLANSAFTEHVTPSAEGLMHHYDNLAASLKTDLDGLYSQHFRGGGKATAGAAGKTMDLTLSDGSRVVVGRFGGRMAFGNAVKDLLLQEDQVARGVRTRTTFDPPASVKAGAERFRAFNRQALIEWERAGLLRGPEALKTAQVELTELEKELADLSASKPKPPRNPKTLFPDQEAQAKLDEKIAAKGKEVASKKSEISDLTRMIGRSESYMTRRYLTHVVKANEADFRARLVNQFRTNRVTDFDTGNPLGLHERPLVENAVNRLEAADKEAIAGKPATDTSPAVEPLTHEQALLDTDPALYQRYVKALEDHFVAKAEGWFKTITKVENGHGVDVAFEGGAPLKERTWEIDESNFRDYLDNDAFRLIDHYNHAVSGRAAVGRAIIWAQDRLAPLVKELLGEELDHTGDQLVRAVKEDFRRKTKAAGEVDAVSGTQIQPLVAKSEAQTLDVLNTLLERLYRKDANPASLSAEVGWRTLGRIAQRMTYIATGGGFLVGNLSDLSGMVLLEGSTPQKLKMIGQGLIPFKEVPRVGLEAIAATADEASSRMMSLLDIEDAVLDPRLASSSGGKSLAYVDQATRWMGGKLNVLNGMNWFNRNNRRVTARILTQNLIAVAKHTAAGHDLDRALGREAAAFWKKQGMTQARAGKLLDMLNMHGTDLEGVKIKDIASHKGLVNPNYALWHNAEPQLFEWMTTTLDRNIRNVITDPSILSRPLMNRYTLGKLFNFYQAFAFAWGNQTLPLAAQHSSQRFAGFLTAAVALGALSDAAKNHLSGRRSLDETAELWATRPLAMMSVAADRAGITSWLGRPLAALNKTPWGPGIPSSTHGNNSVDLAGALFGPVFDEMDRIARGVGPAVREGRLPTARELHTLRTAMPFQNLFYLRALYRFTHDAGLDNPFGPGTGLDLYPLPTNPAHEATTPERPPEP